MVIILICTLQLAAKLKCIGVERQCGKRAMTD